MADGTLKVGTITTSSGSGTITLGQSGETIALGSGVTSKMNQPAFEAYLNSSQTISDAVATKIQFDVEIYDTNNCYDNTTNYRFTPTVAGKYYIYSFLAGDGSGSDDIKQTYNYIYKNGVMIKQSIPNQFNSYPANVVGAPINTVVDMNGSTDYIEIYGLIDITTGTPSILGNNQRSSFGAYRIGA